MAFYNPFPATYQSPYYQQPQIQAPQQANGSIIWVQGEAGAKSYLVAPNTTVQLWDSEAQVIYLKSADASGMPSIRTLDYTIRTERQPVQTISIEDHNYIKREEFDGLKGDIEALRGELDKLKGEEHNG